MPRFTLLETLREYAGERLQASGEAAALAARHAQYFAALARQAAPELRGQQQDEWLARLAADLANLRQALQWWIDHAERTGRTGHAGAAGSATTIAGAGETVDPGSAPPAAPGAAPAPASTLVAGPGAEEPSVTALSFASALRRLWEVRGFLREGRQWLNAVLRLPAAVPHSPAYPAYLAARADALFDAAVLGGVTAGTANAGEYLALVDEALALWQQLGDEEGVAYGLYARAYIHVLAANHAAARAGLEQSAERFRRLEDRRGLGWPLLALGMVLAEAEPGEPAAAQAALDESQAIFQAAGERRGVALAWAISALLAERRGDCAGAWAAYRQSIAELRILGGRADLVWVLDGLASLAVAQGQPERAARLGGAAAALARTVGLILSLPAPLLRRAQHQFAQARQVLGEAAFTAAWTAGEALPLEEALAEALQEPAGPAAGPIYT
jgi:hypothetical protein